MLDDEKRVSFSNLVQRVGSRDSCDESSERNEMHSIVQSESALREQVRESSNSGGMPLSLSNLVGRALGGVRNAIAISQQRLGYNGPKDDRTSDLRCSACSCSDSEGACYSEHCQCTACDSDGRDAGNCFNSEQSCSRASAEDSVSTGCDEFELDNILADETGKAGTNCADENVEEHALKEINGKAGEVYHCKSESQDSTEMDKFRFS